MTQLGAANARYLPVINHGRREPNTVISTIHYTHARIILHLFLYLKCYIDLLVIFDRLNEYIRDLWCILIKESGIWCSEFKVL